MSKFFSQIDQLSVTNQSLLCIGLDTDTHKIPQILKNDADPIFSFNREIIDSTADLVCCYKPQIAYYAANGAEQSLCKSIDYAQQKGIPVILDAKRGDIGATAKMYTAEAFDRYNADAVTINPYMGFDSVLPFLEYAEKGIFILCRTSNPGGSDLQNLRLDSGLLLYQHLASLAANQWNHNDNVGLVVGATREEEIAAVRKIVGNMSFLLPGVGAQGADVASMMQHGKGGGMIINSSRAIIYASNTSNFAQAARRVALETRATINQHR
ncbi:MAG: orotidine-5'-phosphate decarboxylase [Pseudomonadales bacterium]|nr:orotidine-5'-phosphate decarboxylase [Pseudomonadales bacterium]